MTADVALNHPKMAMIEQFEASANPPVQFQGFELELHDFIDSSSFDQFVDLVSGENESPLLNFDLDLIADGCFLDDQLGSSKGRDVLNFNGGAGSDSPQLPMFNRLEKFDDGEETRGGEEDDEDDSSATNTTGTNKTTTNRGKVDRSRTLISERRRRGRMKEKLYALRSLVPNITKMDKASIVGDAVLYVQELQMQAKKLKAEIKCIEASLQRADKCRETTQNICKKTHELPNSTCLVSKKISQMDIFQVEERGFYMRIVCDKGYGVATSLYKALESLMGFNAQSSNLRTTAEKYVLTATLNAMKDCEDELNLPKLKLWLTGALLSHGFEF